MSYYLTSQLWEYSMRTVIIPKIQKKAKNYLLEITLNDLNFFYNDTSYWNYEKEFSDEEILYYLIDCNYVYVDNFGIERFTKKAIEKFL